MTRGISVVGAVAARVSDSWLVELVELVDFVGVEELACATPMPAPPSTAAAPAATAKLFRNRMSLSSGSSLPC